MKTLFVIATCILLPTLSISQINNEVTWAWTGTYGNGTDNSVANHLEVDENSNMYVAGVFRGELAIQSDTIWGNPLEDRVFVAKFDSLGTCLWLRKVDWGYFVNNIRLDSDNDLRVLCNSGIMIVYDGMTGAPITYYNIPNSITDFNSPAPFGQVIDFRLDTDDNMYLVSRVEDSQALMTSARVDVYSTPNDTISSTLWTRSFEVGGFGPIGAGAISLDTNRNVYLTGTTDSYDLTLAGTTITGTPGTTVLFAAKYNAQGDAVWISTNPLMFAEFIANEVNTIDNSLYVTGYTIVTEVFYNDTLVMDTTNQQQIFVMKYDLDGTNQWAKAFPLATKTLKTYAGAS